MDRIDVDKRIFIRARPETVFSYFADAEKMCRWLGRRVSHGTPTTC
jgi:uncharacterized protein YndB with AHSA1/START domain